MKGLMSAALLWIVMVSAAALGYALIAAMAVLSVAVLMLTWPFSGPPRVVVSPAPADVPSAPEGEED